MVSVDGLKFPTQQNDPILEPVFKAGRCPDTDGFAVPLLESLVTQVLCGHFAAVLDNSVDHVAVELLPSSGQPTLDISNPVFEFKTRLRPDPLLRAFFNGTPGIMVLRIGKAQFPGRLTLELFDFFGAVGQLGTEVIQGGLFCVDRGNRGRADIQSGVADRPV